MNSGHSHRILPFSLLQNRPSLSNLRLQPWRCKLALYRRKKRKSIMRRLVRLRLVRGGYRNHSVLQPYPLLQGPSQTRSLQPRQNLQASINLLPNRKRRQLFDRCRSRRLRPQHLRSLIPEQMQASLSQNPLLLLQKARILCLRLSLRLSRSRIWNLQTHSFLHGP